ncbi:MAG: aldehyde dehydrogenase [Proteobacteria bacterium]|nr:aldehyde dehydrogenase [Pseudomonadota bacterium]MDA1356999.1 aldehyde dehydrogenase [Pseudomonadota bacterium]
MAGRYSTATLDDVADAVRVANAAASAPEWHDLLPHNRARILHAIAAQIDDKRDRLATLQMRQNGKTISECRGQAAACAGIFRYYAAVCETQESDVTTPRGPYLSLTVQEPYGAVGLITPWNSPLTMDAQKLAPAIAAGNAVLLKPSEITPGIGLALGRLCQDAGVPPGVVNVLSGTGSLVGNAIVRHPDVRMVSFTGGTKTGRAIAAAAAAKLMPVALELGGKSPHIVFADADIEAAAQAVAGGIFGSMGQSCVAGSRLFVEQRIYEAFVERVVARANAYRIGAPDKEASELGPLASFPHRDRVEALVQSARDDGGRILCGGERPEGFSEGAYYRPTVIDGLGNNAQICQEEVFGPVLVAMPFNGEDDLVAQANDTAYGLACGIWSADFKRAWRMARRIECGTTWINSYKSLSVATPFGGVKESGIGREKGRQGLSLYQQSKSIYTAL